MNNLSKSLLLGCSTAALSLLGGKVANAACEKINCDDYTDSLSDIKCNCGYVVCPFDSSKVKCPDWPATCSEAGYSDNVPDGYTSCPTVRIELASEDGCGIATCYDTSDKSKCTASSSSSSCSDCGYSSSPPSGYSSCPTAKCGSKTCYVTSNLSNCTPEATEDEESTTPSSSGGNSCGACPSTDKCRTNEANCIHYALVTDAMSQKEAECYCCGCYVQ